MNADESASVTTSASPRSANDLRLAAAVEEYLRWLEIGEAPPRRDFLALHPDIASELSACLDGLDFVQQIAPEMRQAEQPSAEEGRPIRPLATLGDYRIVREVGRGGMGVVYEARQLSLNRRVALKVLPYAAVLDRRALARFKNEAQAAAQLDYPNIVALYGIGSDRGVHYYAMRFIDGPTLADCIRQMQQAHRDNRDLRFDSLAEVVADSALSDSQKAATANDPTAAYVGCVKHTSPGATAVSAVRDSLSAPGATAVSAVRDSLSTTPADDTTPDAAAAAPTRRSFHTPAFFRSVAELAAQIADALDHAHEQGIIHRDVKPSNLILDQHGKPYVADFGLARIGSDTAMTVTGDLLGTLRYMSPEQALAKRAGVDHRSDIYSLGATLYELLALRPAFPSENREELLRQIAVDEPISLRRLNKAIPADLETIVLKALSKEPADRYSTAADLAADLRRYVEDKPVKAKRPGIARRVSKWSRRHRAVAVTAALGLLLTVSVLSASLGWTARQKSIRRGIVAAQVEQTLDEARRHIDAGRWSDALAAAQRAEALLSGTDGLSLLNEQARNISQDAMFVQALDRVRERQAEVDVEKNDFRRALASPEFEEAFRIYGIDTGTTPEELAARRIGTSPATVQSAILAALAEWSWVEQMYGKDSSRSGKLLPWMEKVASGTDKDPWRRRLRDAIRKKDNEQLLLLADDAMHSRQPIWAQIKLGEAINEIAGKPARGIAVLMAAHGRHPGDFHLNTILAAALKQLPAPEFQECIRFSSAAIALRPENAGARLNIGTALLDAGRPDEAIGQYTAAIELAPAYTQAHMGLGAALTQLHQLDEAVKEYDIALRLSPDLAEAHFGLGTTLREMGKLNEAIHKYETALRLKPDLAEAHNNLSVVLSEVGRSEEAIAASATAVRLRPNESTVHANLGISLHGAGRLDEAIAAHETAIRLDPNDAELQVNLGNSLRHSGRMVEAMSAFETAIRLDSTLAEAHWNLGSALGTSGRLDEAILEFEEALRLQPDLAEVHGDLGLALRHKGRMQEAIGEFETAIRMKPDYARAHSNLGATLNQLGRWNESIVALTTAVRLDPKDAIGHYNLGNALRVKVRLDEAIAAYEAAICLQPDFAEAHHTLGITLTDKGRLDDAIAAFTAAIGQKPDYANAYFNLGLALGRKGRVEEAIAAYEGGIRFNPNDAQAYVSLGYAQHRMGRLKDAIAAYETAIRLTPDHAEAHFHLGLSLQEVGRFDEAIVAYDEAVRLAPDSVMAHNTLAWLLATCPDPVLCDPTRALELAKRATELAAEDAGCWNTLGVATYRTGDWNGSLTALRRSVTLSDGGGAHDFFFMAMAHWQLGNKDEAASWHARGVEWMDANLPDDEELRRFRAEAEELLGIAPTLPVREDVSGAVFHLPVREDLPGA